MSGFSVHDPVGDEASVLVGLLVVRALVAEQVTSRNGLDALAGPPRTVSCEPDLDRSSEFPLLERAGFYRVQFERSFLDFLFSLQIAPRCCPPFTSARSGAGRCRRWICRRPFRRQRRRSVRGGRPQCRFSGSGHGGHKWRDRTGQRRRP
jgi:hypothetical protein